MTQEALPSPRDRGIAVAETTPRRTFVNYRRDDTRDIAARIRDRLARAAWAIRFAGVEQSV
jgi:hypothetical protein